MADEKVETVQIVVKRLYQGHLFDDRRVLREGIEEVTPAQADYLLKNFPGWFEKVAPAKAGKGEK